MKKGFTLAEVLITLVIIGVVAALTIPTLVQNYRKKQYEAGFGKLYTTIINGFKAYSSKDYCFELKCSKVNDYIINAVINKEYANADNMFNEVFKVSKILKGSEAVGEFEKYYNFDGSILFDMNDYNENLYAVIFSDGSAFLSPGGYGALFVILDINGSKGPNKIGYDAFIFAMPESSDGTLDKNFHHFIIPFNDSLVGFPDGYWKDDKSLCGRPNEKITAEDNVSSGFGCAARIIDEGFKINYY